jgi:hypothetical protein
VALMLLPVVVDNISGEKALDIYTASLERSVLDFVLPDVAYLSSAGLRAPPTLAYLSNTKIVPFGLYIRKE